MPADSEGYIQGLLFENAEQVSSRKPKKIYRDERESLLYSVRDVCLLLGDYDWHKTADAKRIAEEHGSTFDSVTNIIPIAESENGHWICVVSPCMPDEPA